MNFSEFKVHCMGLLSRRMHEDTAEEFFNWVFPEEYKESYEQKLKESDEFLIYATEVLS